jgi:hypothetical protein
VIASLITIGVLAGLVIARGDAAERRNVFNILVPVLSTWVGTVLAYYFSRENFAAATQSVTELARLTTQERLRSIPVIEKMIPRAVMHFEVMSAANPADQIKLVDMIDRQEKAKKGLRIPVLNESFFPLYVIHRSTIDRYLTNRARKDDKPEDIVLKELLDDPDLKKILDESFGVVRRDATLADVKNELDKSVNTQDVFVTEKGAKKEAILGFITNTMVEEYSTV